MWHDRHINKKDIKCEYLVLLCESHIKGKPRKLETTWLGPYVVEYIRLTGVVQLQTLLGKPFNKLINFSHLKNYHV